MTQMALPNEPIEIHKGSVNLRYNNEVIATTSGIVFKWLPQPCVQIKGTTDNAHIMQKAIGANSKLEVLQENSVVGEVMITNLTTSIPSDFSSFSSKILSQIVFGNKNQSVDLIRFEVSNLRNFNGRLALCNDDYEITIDKNQNSENLSKKLKDEGGYILLYSGKIVSQKNTLITFEECENLCDCLSHFFFFLNGRRCSPLFRKGFSGETEVWADYTPYFTDPYQYVPTWPQAFNIEGLNEVWVNFHRLWREESERDVLKTALHWYVEANSNAGFVEGSLTMIQNALELLFSWIMVEKLHYINDGDSEKIPASSKIGIILAYCKIKPEIPPTLIELTKLSKSIKDVNTGPEAITYIRNKIVHPKRKNREQFRKITNGAKRESLQLGLWYVELILLHYLDYKGQYLNRCSGAKPSGEGEEFVPWCQE